METTETLSTYELERGKPIPSDNHGLIQFNLSIALAHYRDQYTIRPELSLELGGQIFVPDLCVHPKRSVSLQHDQIKVKEAPLTTIEILSPTQSMDDLMQKAEAYFEAGVKSCWIVLPAIEAIAVLVPSQKAKVYTEGAITDPATGITIQLAEVFRVD